MNPVAAIFRFVLGVLINPDSAREYLGDGDAARLMLFLSGGLLLVPTGILVTAVYRGGALILIPLAIAGVVLLAIFGGLSFLVLYALGRSFGCVLENAKLVRLIGVSFVPLFIGGLVGLVMAILTMRSFSWILYGVVLLLSLAGYYIVLIRNLAKLTNSNGYVVGLVYLLISGIGLYAVLGQVG